MNTYNLDGNDFLLVISLLAALIIGFFPSIYPFRNQNNQISKWGFVMIIFFGIALLLTFFSTLSKSAADKEDYKNLFDSTIVTLKKSDETSRQSKEILQLQDKSIINLEELQRKSVTAQRQSITLLEEVAEVQNKSQILNRMLAHEISLQKKLNLKSTEIVNKLTAEEQSTETYNHVRFLFSYSRLYSVEYILLDALQEINLDQSKMIEYLLKDSNSREKIDKMIADTFQNLYITYLANTNRNITLKLKDTSRLESSLKNYFSFTMSILESQLSNPFVYKNSPLLAKWMTYNSYLFESQSIFFMDKKSINNVSKIRELIKKNKEFIAAIQQIAVLKVALK